MLRNVPARIPELTLCRLLVRMVHWTPAYTVYTVIVGASERSRGSQFDYHTPVPQTGQKRKGYNSRK